MHSRSVLLSLALASLPVLAAAQPQPRPQAQPLAAPASSAALPSADARTEAGIAQYRAMLADGNPAELFEARGEALWAAPRGPRQLSLQGCDLGLGPGVVAGAWARLPRWFADTGKVQDLESRLLSCMERLQGFDAAAVAATPFGQGEQRTLEALVAWVAGQSRGLPLQLPQAHPQERRAYQLGQRLFNFRAGPLDMACATCHGAAGRRIRLQELPDLRGNPGDGQGFAAWPAYRLSSGELWGMQRRLSDCFRQQRFPSPGYGSEATIALSVYLGVNAQGALAAAPALRR